MAFLFGLLTVVLVLDCVVLILLVLVQLPKKEAGAGLAFGGAATDALFGAGSGNMLTKITKYAAGIFFILAIGLGLMASAMKNSPASDFQRELDKQAKQSASAMPLQPVESSTPATAPAGSNLLTTPAAAPTTATPAATTNPAPAK
jgi:preprotein translocase subunit SecG